MVDYSTKSFGDGDGDKISLWHKAALSILDFHNKKVLDIGCGSGGFILHLKEKYNCEVLGIDPNKINTDVASRHKLEVINNYPENVLGLDNRFDIVTSFEVIEHLYDHINTIKTFEKSLKSGGLGLISTPNAFNIIRRVKFALFAEHHDTLMDPTTAEYPEHIRLWSRGMMTRIVNATPLLSVKSVYGASSIFGKLFIFKNRLLVQLLSQHLIVVLVKNNE